MTAGINALPIDVQGRVFDEVRKFESFTPDNDPYGEHDCGVLEIDDTTIIWKIDYYDPTFTVHSEDATDESATGRLLTIMLAEEN